MRYRFVATAISSVFLGIALLGGQEPPAAIQYLEQNARNGRIVAPISQLDGSSLRDTFNEIHNGHLHHAIDIMKPRGTPVRAVVSGTIRKLFHSAKGGNTIYEFDQVQQFCYYYAHLDSYAAGLHDGSPITKGQIIGLVGATGDASPDAPHLHFAIYRLGPDKSWWKGIPIDPCPVLVQAAKSRR